jgi:hypothetical protein
MHFNHFSIQIDTLVIHAKSPIIKRTQKILMYFKWTLLFYFIYLLWSILFLISYARSILS